jgi:hypothetical protein
MAALRRITAGSSLDDFLFGDNADGFNINRAIPNRGVTRRYHRFSTFDSDNVVVDVMDGKGYQVVSVMRQVGKANYKKCVKINRYKHLIKGRE